MMVGMAFVAMDNGPALLGQRMNTHLSLYLNLQILVCILLIFFSLTDDKTSARLEIYQYCYSKIFKEEIVKTAIQGPETLLKPGGTFLSHQYRTGYRST